MNQNNIKKFVRENASLAQFYTSRCLFSEEDVKKALKIKSDIFPLLYIDGQEGRYEVNLNKKDIVFIKENEDDNYNNSVRATKTYKQSIWNNNNCYSLTDELREMTFTIGDINSYYFSVKYKEYTYIYPFCFCFKIRYPKKMQKNEILSIDNIKVEIYPQLCDNASNFYFAITPDNTVYYSYNREYSKLYSFQRFLENHRLSNINIIDLEKKDENIELVNGRVKLINAKNKFFQENLNNNFPDKEVRDFMESNLQNLIDQSINIEEIVSLSKRIQDNNKGKIVHNFYLARKINEKNVALFYFYVRCSFAHIQSVIILNENKTTIYSENFDGYNYAKKYDFSCYNHSHYTGIDICVNSEDSLREIVNTTFLKNRGFLDAYGLNPDHPERKIEDLSVFGNPDSYGVQVVVHPGLELILKQFGADVFSKKEFIYDKKMLNIDETNLEKIFDCPMSYIKLWDSLKNERFTFVDFCKIIPVIKTVNPNDFRKIASYFNRFPTEHVDKIMEVLAIPPQVSTAKLMDYYLRCYEYQCIDYNDIFTLYRDYYKMANDLKYNLSDAKIAFPNSLKREHDRATKIYKLFQNQIQREHFDNNVKKYLDFEYSDDKFCIFIAKTPEELIREGEKQSHCVGSYVRRIEEGRCGIAFLRVNTDEKRDIPLYTIEISPQGNINQIRGYSNCLIKEPEIKDFVSKWISQKNLKKNNTLWND